MRKLVVFGLFVLLAAGGCSDDRGDTGTGDGDAGWDGGDDVGGDDGAGSDSGDNGAGDAPEDGTAQDGGDGGGGEVDCRFDPGVTWSIIGEILQMESADSGTCVWLKRKDECPPGWICKANPFTLEQVRIGHDGRVHEFDGNNADLTWNATWHNWEDSGTIDTGTTLYTLTAQSYGQAYEITASGGESWGPVLLEPWEP